MTPLPDKFEDAMRQQLESEFGDFMGSLRQLPPVSIRLHPIKNKGRNYDQRVPWTKTGVYLSLRPVFTLDPLFHAGCYYVQEASSMFLEQVVTQHADLAKPLNVLDLCAAPGGKSTHLLGLLNREALLVSNEVIRSRATILSENIQKCGYPNVLVTNNDPGDFKNLTGFFDVILLDAPCSGEGLFRKEPEAIEEWSPGNVQLCSSRQKRIIADVWNALRQDGLFIYCTCTYNTSENEQNLEWLSNTKAVEFLKVSLDPSWGIEEVNHGNITGYRFYPHKIKGEGFFLSAMRKLDAAHPAAIKPSKQIAGPLKKISDRLTEWITDPHQSDFLQFKDLIFYVPSSKSREIQYLLNRLRVMYAGTNTATLKHDKLIPEHALALSVEVNKENFQVIKVDEEDALRYLRRESIRIEGNTGFALLTYQEVPIGWVNVLSNRVNNMYPPEWRIRMSGRPL